MKHIAVRIKSLSGIETFKACGDHKELLDALAHTGNDVFAFEYEGDDNLCPNDVKVGRVIERCNKGARPTALSRTIQHRAYADTIWEEYGTADFCLNKAHETNEQAVCWASIRAHVRHVAGSLYACVYEDPYKD